ncbi:MAG: hypothetical protein RIB03_03775 [Henriciella sp.]|uniref:hypothetical protein n=1 Tax=Henriciella sp. TaxID=1968823 RepID=UPI0032EE53C6
MAQAVWILLTYTSPYEAMPGRVNYDLGSMVLNGLSIINRSISSFWDPMINTGQLTRQSSLWVSIGFICIMLVMYIATGLRLLRGSLDWGELRLPLSFTFFMSVCAVLSIGPYTALRSSHLWHYFPHMIFLCTSSYLLVYFTVSKRGAYLLLAITAFLTTQTYSQQMPAYQDIVQQQKSFSNFIRLESKSWHEGDRVFLLFEGRILAGLNSSFRSTGFTRYVIDDPDAPVLSIVSAGSASRTDINDDGDQGQVHFYKMDQAGAYKPIR